MLSGNSMSKEDSYVQRRLLFKNIWDASMHIDEKEDILAKPRVIKTLRMDEIDKCPVGKTKKQRIKNLRHVCHRILDFCNKQDAEDQIYERISAKRSAAKSPSPKLQAEKHKRIKGRVKRKIRKAKSLATPDVKDIITVARVSMANSKTRVIEEESAGTSRRATPHSSKKNYRTKRVAERKTLIGNEQKNVQIKSDDFPKETVSAKQKILKKKRHTRGKKKIVGTLQRETPQIICV